MHCHTVKSGAQWPVVLFKKSRATAHRVALFMGFVYSWDSIERVLFSVAKLPIYRYTLIQCTIKRTTPGLKFCRLASDMYCYFICSTMRAHIQGASKVWHLQPKSACTCVYILSVLPDTIWMAGVHATTPTFNHASYLPMFRDPSPDPLFKNSLGTRLCVSE